MHRIALETLLKWKTEPNRKPLVIQGAKQVGKTWLMNEFGRQAYAQTLTVHLADNPRMKELFSADFQVSRIIMGLELYLDCPITPENTLLIFEEVEAVPRVMAAVAYLAEQAPQYHILCAGTAIDRAFREEPAFPVEKVQFLRLYPLTFKEFLLAIGKERYIDLLNGADYALISTFQQDLLALLKQYFFVGGMPEAVQAFAERADYAEVRAIQQRILTGYQESFSAQSAEFAGKLLQIWQCIPDQLAKENKKFVYGLLHDGARAKEYEPAVRWLADEGVIRQVPRVTVGQAPLKDAEDPKAFKMYLTDVGLLGCMVGVSAEVLQNGDAIFAAWNEALTEQYVLQELITDKDLKVYYYTNEMGLCDVDFVVEDGEAVVPVEVQGKVNLRAKTLKSFVDKYAPKVAIRTSPTAYQAEGRFLHIPLYAL